MDIKIGYVSETANLDFVKRDLEKAHIVGIDSETTSLDALSGKVRTVQVATSEAAWVMDLFKLPKGPVAEMLARLLADKTVVKVFQNGKFDLKFFNTNLGIDLHEIESIFDTYIAAKLLDGGQYMDAGLDNLAEKYLNVRLDKTFQKFDWSGTLYKEPIAYAGLDAAILLPLYRILSRSLVLNKLHKVAKLEFDCVPAIAQLEVNGVAFDKEQWLEYAEQNKEEMHQHEILLREYFGHINLNSNPQLCKALSQMTGMDIRSVAKDALSDLIRNYYEKPDLFGRVTDYRRPVMLLQQYNEVKKMATTYGHEFLKHIHKKTGRVHTEYTQIETNTGRFSSRGPNLQNIPRDKDIRAAFIAPEGRELWCSDYSQIELRILAEFSGDEGYVHAFRNNIDAHSSTAQGMFGCELGKEDGEQRVCAKISNFSIPYGVSKTSYAVRYTNQTGKIMTPDEAQKLIDSYYDSHQGVVNWHESMFRYFRRFGCVRSASGRIRALPNWRYDEYPAMQAAKNMPIQATNADITKAATVRCHNELPHDIKLVLSVHDELVFEMPEGWSEEYGPEIDRIMRECAEEYVTRVPVLVDGHVSKVWTKG